jgi:hypothetical protein
MLTIPLLVTFKSKAFLWPTKPRNVWRLSELREGIRCFFWLDWWLVYVCMLASTVVCTVAEKPAKLFVEHIVTLVASPDANRTTANVTHQATSDAMVPMLVSMNWTCFCSCTNIVRRVHILLILCISDIVVFFTKSTKQLILLFRLRFLFFLLQPCEFIKLVFLWFELLISLA